MQIEHIYSKLLEILDGSRPYLNNKEGERQVTDLIHRLSEQGLLIEHPKVYYRREETEPVTGINPVPSAMIKQRKEIERHLPAEWLPDIRFAGNFFAWTTENEIDQLINSTRAMVAMPGHMPSIVEACYLILNKSRGECLDYPLVLYNQDKLLNSLITAIGIDEESFPELGIYVEDDATKIRQRLENYFAEQWVPLEDPLPRFALPEGAVVFLATGTEKKAMEIADIMRHHTPSVEFRWIYYLTDTYVSPDEDKRTYQGNFQVKPEGALQAWNSMSIRERDDRLKALGLTEEQIFLMGEDSGIRFLGDFCHEPEFADLIALLTSYSRFPGVETGHVMTAAMGMRNMMKRVEEIIARRMDENPNYVPDMRVKQECVLGIVSLSQPFYGKIQTFSVSVSRESFFRTTPMPAIGPMNLDNFLIPIDDEDGRTEALLGYQYKTNNGVRAEAWQALADQIVMPAVKSPIPSIIVSNEPEILHLAILCNSSNQADIEQEVTQYLVDHSTEKYHLHYVLCEDIQQPEDVQNLWLAKGDALIFAPDPQSWQENFWLNEYITTSAIVAHQTHDKFRMGKPFVQVNDGTFDYMFEHLWSLHDVGTIPENLRELITEVPDIDFAMQQVGQQLERYTAYHLPLYSREPFATEISGVVPKGNFSLGVFTSASNENRVLLENTNNLVTSAIVDQDWQIITGGGHKGRMGKITNIAAAMRRSHSAKHFGCSVPHIMSGEGDVRQYVTGFARVPHIAQRMKILYGLSTAVNIEGAGAGTLQEWSLGAWMQHRLLKNPEDDLAQQLVSWMPIIVTNENVPSVPGERFYSGLIDHMPPNNSMVISPSPEKTLEFLADYKKALTQELHQQRITHLFNRESLIKNARLPSLQQLGFTKNNAGLAL